jgi:PAS domain S-box-containing protein
MLLAHLMSRQKILVLHVDDEPEFAELTGTFLERDDDRFTVETVTGADRGLERVDDNPPDCIVSDYNMPGMDGLEFLQAVREDYSDLPFILFTGKGSEEIASDAISAGVTDYLEKKSGTSQYTVLANRIRNAVDKYDAQTELADREKRLNLFFEQSPLGVVEWDEHFDIVRLNEAAEEILGYSQTDLLGHSWEKIVPESDQAAVGDVVSDLLENKGGYHSINENVRKDGEQVVCEWHNRVVTDESGAVVAIFSQFQDITEERQQRLQLEETAARLEALFHRSPDMVNIHDSDGNILDVNQRLAERTGYDKPELTEMKVWDVDAGITADDARTLWEDMDPDDRRQVEGVFECRDGSTFPVEVHIRRLDMEDQDLFVVISRDITEQTKREEELHKQNERLDKFASIVSHDLRNPLTVAEGHLELARETCENENLGKAAAAIDRSQALIDDLLTLAREGDQATNVEPVALADIAESCWQTTETKSATLDVTATQAIRADRSRLQQLFENLYRNAVEHGGPDVTVSFGAMDDGFYVADTGPGIPESDRQEVFEAGYSTSEEGTGFGLWIVEQVADAHGWDIRVCESTDGGARFEVTGVERADE